MKVIIDDKLYDTDKAEFVFDAEGMNLFRTEKGSYFFKVESSIRPCSEEDAKNFIGRNDYEKYIKIFGEVEEA